MWQAVVVLTLLLIASLVANAYQWYRWHSYRSKPAGTHSHTGFMTAVKVKK